MCSRRWSGASLRLGLRPHVRPRAASLASGSCVSRSGWSWVARRRTRCLRDRRGRPRTSSSPWPTSIRRAPRPISRSISESRSPSVVVRSRCTRFLTVLRGSPAGMRHTPIGASRLGPMTTSRSRLESTGQPSAADQNCASAGRSCASMTTWCRRRGMPLSIDTWWFRGSGRGRPPHLNHRVLALRAVPLQPALHGGDRVLAADRREHVEGVLGAGQLGIRDGGVRLLPEGGDEGARLLDRDDGVVAAVDHEEVGRVLADLGQRRRLDEVVEMRTRVLAEHPRTEEPVAHVDGRAAAR